MCGAADENTIAAVRQRAAVGREADYIGIDRHPESVARQLDTVPPVPGEHVGPSQVVAPRGSDKQAVIAVGGGALECQQATERVEGNESAHPVSPFYAVLA